ncbi:hypothetical protein ACTTAL_03465 [Rhodobacter capsulatus]|uniref:hypothetical protein n=1 Tax=Rhodobacter capsulatus TaxID=1061 RepID=UPI001F5210F7|nr:hypothetical protein [Rhodobacter capsulatus]
MYMPGETAGFSKADAEALIAAGKAVNADAATVEAQEPAADTEAAEVQAEAAAVEAQAVTETEAAPPAKKRG